VEAEGELEGVGGETATEDEDVGGDAGVGVFLAGDGMAGDRAVVGGPDAEGEPARPAVGLSAPDGGSEAGTGESLDPGAGRRYGVPGGDQLAEGVGRRVDGRDSLAGVRGGSKSEGAAVGIDGGVFKLPGGEGGIGGAEGG